MDVQIDFDKTFFNFETKISAYHFENLQNQLQRIVKRGVRIPFTYTVSQSTPFCTVTFTIDEQIQANKAENLWLSFKEFIDFAESEINLLPIPIRQHT